MLPLPNKRTSFKQNSQGFLRWPWILVLLIWFAALGIAAANRQNLLDWWALRDYQAAPPVAQLVAQDTMTPYATKVFYVNHPSIDTKTAFSQACPAGSAREQTIVLGCYHSNQAGIYLLAVNNSQLDGVEQVTAAHEMLHAAYDRLSSSERQKVDAMLQDYYNHLTDSRLLATFAAYRKTEPDDLVNEMHSIFGTEVANLPANLEQYYQRYFTNRSQIAAYAAQYQAEFTSRQAVLAQDDAQLSSLKSQIDAKEADLKSRQSQISGLQAQLVSERGSNPEAYNAGVPGYNAQVDSYNAEVDQVQAMVGQYNKLVAARNTVALEEDQLVNDLSTSVSPIGQ